MQEGKVIGWRLELSRYFFSIEKNSRAYAVLLSGYGPLSDLRVGTRGWEEAAPLLLAQISEILGVGHAPLHQFFIPIW